MSDELIRRPARVEIYPALALRALRRVLDSFERVVNSAALCDADDRKWKLTFANPDPR